MIMVPVLILQIFLFPLTAAIIMDNWNTTQRNLELQEVAGHLGSTIQQLYYTITRIDENCEMKINLDLPTTTVQYGYTVTLGQAQVDPSVKIMNITLQVSGAEGSGSSVVPLGSEVDWPINLSFESTDPNLSLVATKTGGSINLSVEGVLVGKCIT